jgi:uncharacterized membrane protein YeaQ/YmgE (transglycosylase-associated protein family)
MAQVAREFAWRPVRADVVPHAQGVKAGDPVPVKVELLDGSGKLTNALLKTDLIVEAVGPSGKTQTLMVEISPGASSADVTFPGMEPGLTKLTVRQPRNEVLESSNFVLITPAAPAHSPTTKKKKKTPAHKPMGRFETPVVGVAHLRDTSLLVFDWPRSDEESAGASPSPPGPQLMFQVSGERDSNVRADQTSYERIAVYYMDSAPAKFPIQIWLTWNHGEVTPNPLIIKKGERFAEAHWTSGWPAAGAKVTIADIKPAIPLNGAGEATINFVEPVSGVAFFNPPATLSIVDAYSLHARFYDLAGNFVKTSDKRRVTVSTSNPIVHFKPDTQDTDWDFATNLIPTGWGQAEIQVATPGYPPFTHTVVITYLAVLWTCVVGGLLGSFADVLTDANKPRGWRIPARLIVGTLAALLASWAYVVIGIPEVAAGVLRSRIAVAGVSLVGGWAGIVVFRRVAKALGIEV